MSGFTLVELLVTMTIAAILLGITVPSFRYVTTSNRMSGEINTLLGDMQYARSEALKEGQTVTICRSSDGLACLTSPTAGTGWEKGWIIFSDPAANKTVPGTGPLRVQKGFVGGDTLSFDKNISAVTFNREGFAFQVLTLTAITATLHDKTNNTSKARCLALTTGRITTETPGTAGATQLTTCK